GGEAGISGGEAIGLEYLVGVIRRDGNPRGADQEAVVFGNGVYLVAVGGAEPAATQRVLTNQDGAVYRGVTGCHQLVESPAHEGELQEHGLVFQVAESAPRHLGGTVGVDQIERLAQGGVIGRLEVELGSVADLAHHLGVL